MEIGLLKVKIKKNISGSFPEEWGREDNLYPRRGRLKCNLETATVLAHKRASGATATHVSGAQSSIEMVVVN